MHTIIKIAVVSVLSLFAIVGLVSISKAEEKKYTIPPTNVRHLYEICNANDNLNTIYCLGHLNGMLDSLSMNCMFQKIFKAEKILVPTVSLKNGTTTGELKNIFLGWAAQNKDEWETRTSLAFGAFLEEQNPCVP